MTANLFRRTSTLRRTALLMAIAALTVLTGCHSAFVQATILNHTGTSLRLVELEYPSASFGTTKLEADAGYQYRFKIQGSGSARLNFVDAQGITHHAVGPELDEGQEGTLLATINASGGVTWLPQLVVTR